MFYLVLFFTIVKLIIHLFCIVRPQRNYAGRDRHAPACVVAFICLRTRLVIHIEIVRKDQYATMTEREAKKLICDDDVASEDGEDGDAAEGGEVFDVDSKQYKLSELIGMQRGAVFLAQLLEDNVEKCHLDVCTDKSSASKNIMNNAFANRRQVASYIGRMASGSPSKKELVRIATTAQCKRDKSECRPIETTPGCFERNIPVRSSF